MKFYTLKICHGSFIVNIRKKKSRMIWVSNIGVQLSRIGLELSKIGIEIAGIGLSELIDDDFCWCWLRDRLGVVKGKKELNWKLPNWRM